MVFGSAFTQVATRWALYRADSQFITGSVHLKFVVLRLAMGQILFRIIWCDSVTIASCTFTTHAAPTFQLAALLNNTYTITITTHGR